MSESESRKEEGPDEEAQPLTGEAAGPAPMRLRAEPPRVTRLSRKVLAGLGLVASVGIGGAGSPARGCSTFSGSVPSSFRGSISLTMPASRRCG